MSFQFEGYIFFFFPFFFLFFFPFFFPFFFSFYFLFFYPCVVARKLVEMCEASFQFEGDVSFLIFLIFLCGS